MPWHHNPDLTSFIADQIAHVIGDILSESLDFLLSQGMGKL